MTPWMALRRVSEGTTLTNQTTGIKKRAPKCAFLDTCVAKSRLV